MSVKCAICNRTVTKNKISFFRFPMSIPIILQEWIRAVNRKNWIPTSSSRVCQLHFNDTDFTTAKKRLRLKPDVIPTQNLSNKSLENNINFDMCNIEPITIIKEEIEEDSTETMRIQTNNIISNVQAEKRKIEPLERTDIKYMKLEEENKKLKDMIKLLTKNYEEKLQNQADMFKILIEKEKNALKEKLAVQKQKFRCLQKRSNRTEKKLKSGST